MRRRGKGNGGVRPVQDVQGIFRSMTRSCAAFDQRLRLIQDPSCEQPYTDLVGKTVHVPELNVYWPEEKIKMWRGYTTHEIGHHAPEVQDTAPFLIKNNMNYESIFGKIMNVLDDIRNELNPRVQQFPGFKKDLSWTQGYHALEGIKKVKEQRAAMSPDMLLFAEALALAYKYRASYQPDVAYPSGLWEAEGFGTKYYHLLPRIEAMSTIEDVYNLTLEFCDPPEDDGSDKSDESDNGDKGDGEESDGEGAQGEGASDEDGSDKRDCEGEVSYKDLMGHQHTTEQKGGSGYGLKINYDHDRADDYKPHTKQTVTNARDLQDEDFGVYERAIQMAQDGTKLSAKARRLFQARSQTRITHNHKAGRLDKRDLYRIPSGARDVFKRKEAETSMKGIAIMLLCDASGSMSGPKYDCLAAASTLLHESVTPLGIPLKIGLFTESGCVGLKHFVVKDWTERRSREDMLHDFAKVYEEMGSNADGESIIWATNELMKRQEQRKVLIVMSDGQPASSRDGDCWTYTKSVAEQVSSKVECYGIGIMNGAVKDFYKDRTVLHSPNELEACLLDVIKHKILD